MRSLLSVVVVVTLSIALTSSAVHAGPQGKAPAKKGAAPDPNVEQAKKYFQLGTTNYDLGNYQDALDAFEKARSLKPLPGFLFNIGQCHRRLGHHDEAIKFYEQYLAELPSAPNKQDVVELLAETKQARDDAAKAAAAAKPAETSTTSPEANIANAQPLTPENAESTTTSGEGDDQMMLWAAVGGGAAVLLAGGIVAAALIPGPSKASLGRVDLRGAQ